MDENKKSILVGINYSMHKACGNCTHGSFPNNDWGTCFVHTYDHLKHTGGSKSSTRQLSINRYGVCDKHDYSALYIENVSHFSDFVKA